MEVKFSDDISDAAQERASSYLSLLVHKMNHKSIAHAMATRSNNSVQRNRGEWRACDILRAAELDCLPVDDPQVVRIRESGSDHEHSPVILTILEASTHKLTVADGYDTICAAYHENPSTFVPGALITFPL